jgi:hypothetical protein
VSDGLALLIAIEYIRLLSLYLGKSTLQRVPSDPKVGCSLINMMTFRTSPLRHVTSIATGNVHVTFELVSNALQDGLNVLVGDSLLIVVHRWHLNRPFCILSLTYQFEICNLLPPVWFWLGQVGLFQS